MITGQDIDAFYQQHKNNISIALDVENALLRKEQDEHQWIILLKEKSALLRAFYRRNEVTLDQLIRPILNGSIPLTREIAASLLKNIIAFSKEYYYDSLVTLDILERLLSFYKEEGDTDSTILCYFYLGCAEDSLCYLDHLEKAVSYDNEVISYFDYYKVTQRRDVRHILLSAFYNRIVSASTQEEVDGDRLLAYEKETLSLLEDPHFSLAEEDFPFRRFLYWIKSLTSSTVILGQKSVRCSSETLKECFEIVGLLAEQESNFHSFLYDWDITIFTAYQKSLFLQKQITVTAYFDSLLHFYQHLDFSVDFNDPEFIDSRPFEAVRVIVPELISFIDKTDLTEEAIFTIVHRLSNQVQNFCIQIPKQHKIYAINHVIVQIIQSLLSHRFLQSEAIPIIQYITVNRQIATSIHTQMVIRISHALLNRILDTAPELCIGCLSLCSREDVLLHQNDLRDFLKNCAFLHDIGKNAISEFIDLQSRKITTAEFDIIKSHAVIGASILDHIPSLQQYKDVCLGHHLYYDKSKGYALEFKVLHPSYQFFIDLISISDCIDAATDLLGRNYCTGKQFKEVLQELIEGKYTRYSGRIVSIIENDPILQQVLEELTTTGRNDVYYEIYQNAT
ncbi:MAG: HD domain-containing protein [Acetivibrio sp.]